MKYSFSIVVSLVAVSLLWVTVCQVFRLRDMGKLRLEQVKESIRIAGVNAAEQLRTDRMDTDQPDTRLLAEIDTRIREALTRVNLEGIAFEFALLKSTTMTLDSAISSQGFTEAMMDDPANFSTVNIVYHANPVYPKPVIYGSLAIVVPGYKSVALAYLRTNIIITAVFIILLLLAFFFVIHALKRQRRQSSIRSELVRRLVLDFEKPIATIALAADAMKHEKVMQDRERMNYFTGIIREENQKMHRRWKLF